jgi:hypothetical protein
VSDAEIERVISSVSIVGCNNGKRRIVVVRRVFAFSSFLRLFIVCSLRWSAQTGRTGDLVAVVMARSDAGKTP